MTLFVHNFVYRGFFTGEKLEVLGKALSRWYPTWNIHAALRARLEEETPYAHTITFWSDQPIPVGQVHTYTDPDDGSEYTGRVIECEADGVRWEIVLSLPPVEGQ